VKRRGLPEILSNSSELRTSHSILRTPDGFTLLEVMVALAILALGVVTVLELFSGSLRIGTKASRHTQATLYAQNLMDRIFAEPLLMEGEEGGEFSGGYGWRARVQEIHPDENLTRMQLSRQNPTEFFHLLDIEVRVSWDEGRGEQAFVLHSLRVITTQQNQQ
jgi:general secretion pathway protein I